MYKLTIAVAAVLIVLLAMQRVSAQDAGLLCTEENATPSCEANVDRPGADFLSITLPAPEPALCRAYCGRHQRCLSYTYVKPGYQGDAAKCWLKESDAVAPVASDCCVSGVKRAGAPPFSLNAPALAASIDSTGRPIFERTLPAQGLKPAVLVIGYYADPTGVYIPPGQLPPGVTAPTTMAPQGQRLVQPQVGQLGMLRPMNPLDGPPAALERFVFGPAAPNMLDYFFEASNGTFAFFNAGVIGPVQIRRQPTSPEDEAGLGVAAAAASGFDFGPFDANLNGKIEESELTLVLLTNLTSGTAAYRTEGQYFVEVETRPFGGPPRLGFGRCGQATTVRDGSRRALELCPGVAAAGFDAAFDNVVHEMTHAIGGSDIYNGAECWSGGFSLMSCSSGRSGGIIRNHLSFHPDPWHKAQFGWVKPRYLAVQAVTAGSSFGYTLVAPQAGREQPIILYDRDRRRNEYFMIEWRSGSGARSGPGIAQVPQASNIATGGYDSNVAGDGSSGIVVWHVAHAPGQPASVRSNAGFLDLFSIAFSRVPNPGDDIRLDLDSNGVIESLEPGPNGVLDSAVGLPAPAAGQTGASSRNYALLQTSHNPLVQQAQGCAPYPMGAKQPLFWLDGSSVGVSLDIVIASEDSGRAVLVVEQGEERRRVGGHQVNMLNQTSLNGMSCGRPNPARSAIACRDRCLADVGCGAFTFLAPGAAATTQGAIGQCVLMRSVTGAVPSTNATSGTVAQVLRGTDDLTGIRNNP